jgi:hypothetical protein
LFLEDLAAGEVALRVAVVVNGSVQRSEGLQGAHAPDAQHGPMLWSEWLVRILGSAVAPPAGLALIDGAQNLERCSIGRQSIGDDRLGLARTIPNSVSGAGLASPDDEPFFEKDSELRLRFRPFPG